MFFELNLWQLLIINTLAWGFFQMGISIFMVKVADSYYERESYFYRSFSWEKNGQLWQDLFKVNEWKKYLPDSSAILKEAFNKKNLSAAHPDTLEKFILETKRAEQTHWLAMVAAPLFFLWNPPWAGWLMVFYAFLANFPFIIVQRYNRPRAIRLWRLMEKRSIS